METEIILVNHLALRTLQKKIPGLVWEKNEYWGLYEVLLLEALCDSLRQLAQNEKLSISDAIIKHFR